MKSKNMKVKILFVSANPINDLSLDTEFRAIELAIKGSPHRDLIDIRVKLACRMTDFINLLNQEKPDIIHFAGHGVGARGLLFANPSAKMQVTINEGTENEERVGVDLVTAEHLHSILKTANKNLKLLFLNACRSSYQAEQIAKEIDFAIGMSDFVFDGTAIILAEQFYGSFASGQSIMESFRQALTVVEVQSPDEDETPQLFVKDKEVKDITVTDMLVDIEEKSEEKIVVKGDVIGVVHNNGELTQHIYTPDNKQ